MSSKRTARDCVSHFRRHSIGHQEYKRQSEEQVGSRDHNNDLVYMKGPLTEDALNRILASRFSQSHRSIRLGHQIVVRLNTCHDTRHQVRTSTSDEPPDDVLRQFVGDAVTSFHETHCPLAFVVDGSSSSGKSLVAKLVQRHLVEHLGGGGSRSADVSRHIRASLTVLHLLTACVSSASPDIISLAGLVLESHVTDGLLKKATIQLSLFRSNGAFEKQQQGNIQCLIFHCMLAGLSPAEKSHYGLNQSIVNRVLGTQQQSDHHLQRLQTSYTSWKESLGILGIPAADILQILSAIVLIQAFTFHGDQHNDLQITDRNCLSKAASLLGVGPSTLLQALTTSATLVRNQPVRTACNIEQVYTRCQILARSLYVRTVLVIVRRINSFRPHPQQLSTVSNVTTSTVSMPTSQHSKSSGSSGDPLRSSYPTSPSSSADDQRTALITVIDMPGFVNLPQNNDLEQLHINLVAETLQHFYNCHVFKCTEEACVDESVQADMDIEFTENAPIIDMISSDHTGLLSLLNLHCELHKSTVDNFLQQASVQLTRTKRFHRTNCQPNQFVIEHSWGGVTYNARDFLSVNRDSLPADLATIFAKGSCTNGFTAHLFAQELKYSTRIDVNTGHSHNLNLRILPTNLYKEQPGTLSQDFYLQLDAMLRQMVSSQPYFIRCVRVDKVETQGQFDRSTVSGQLRSLQVLETLHLLLTGFPNRLRFRQFVARYYLLMNSRHGNQTRQLPDQAFLVSKAILNDVTRRMDHMTDEPPMENTPWALGSKNVFLSEQMLLLLERMRRQRQWWAASVIERWWRRRRMTGSRHRQSAFASLPSSSSLPLARSRSDADMRHTTPEDQQMLQIQAQPPPLPARRQYFIDGDVKRYVQHPSPASASRPPHLVLSDPAFSLHKVPHS